MALERPVIGSLDGARRRLERGVDVADLFVVLAMHRLGIPEVVEDALLGRKVRRRVRPGHGELVGSPDRVPLLRRDHGEEALLVDDLDAGNILHRRLRRTTTGTEPATGGRMTRACSMPGTLMSTT